MSSLSHFSYLPCDVLKTIHNLATYWNRSVSNDIPKPGHFFVNRFCNKAKHFLGLQHSLTEPKLATCSRILTLQHKRTCSSWLYSNIQKQFLVSQHTKTVSNMLIVSFFSNMCITFATIFTLQRKIRFLPCNIQKQLKKNSSALGLLNFCIQFGE